jgi:hypothetical protein
VVNPSRGTSCRGCTDQEHTGSTNDASDVVREVEGTAPVAVRPIRSTPRIVAQRGVFTIHGKEVVTLNQVARTKTEIKLEKIVVAGGSKPRLKKELLLAGTCHSTVFPELEGLAPEIQYRYSPAYGLKSP